MSEKLLLLFFLMLKSCSISEIEDFNPYHSWLTISIMNDIPKNEYVWYEMVLGNGRRLISGRRIFPALNGSVFPVSPIGNQSSYITWMNTEDENVRLDTLFIYFSPNQQDFESWYDRRISSLQDDSDYYEVKYTIVKDNIANYIPTYNNNKDKIVIHYTGIIQ